MKRIEKHSRPPWLLLGAVVPVLFAGCAVGPHYKAPAISAAPAFANSPTNSAATANDALLATWWKGFGDPQLDALVDQAIAQNHDLRIATANLREARALRRLATFDLAPTVQANGSYANSLLSQAAALPGTPRDARQIEFYDAGFDATWELDLFGRVRRSVEASNAQLGAADANRLDVLVSVTSEVARNYFELRGLQNRLGVARRNSDVQSETLKITESRLEGGRGTEFDVSRSRSLLNLTLSTIPPLEGAIQKTIHRLAVLTGQQPANLNTELTAAKPLPTVSPALALGNPESVLRRRPDVRVAERSLAAATARIGVATGDLFPRVTFVGSVGLQSSTFSGLAKGGADSWSFGPHITWAAFDLGRVYARIKASDARAEASLAIYERTVLRALEETENALVDLGREQSRQQFLQSSAEASQQAATLAKQRFEGGATDFLGVLDSERTLLEAQDRLADSQTRTATAWVAVYKALGGGIPLTSPQ
ncbi:MAG TPA: efflux transporter outer membrane subunit [Candidatus Limnocylindria bacterium]|nr:efflux transporter outer membrane subunit [Candidatus Limnocylindria bacterium]